MAWTTPADPFDWHYQSYLDLVNNPPSRPKSGYRYDYLPKVLVTPIREQDLQVARELVEWLYENTDLGHCKFYNSGVYTNGPQLPGVACEYGRPDEGGFPKITAQALDDVLNTDVFGVGVRPADCRLRALSISAAYEVQCVLYAWEKQQQPFSELEALTTVIPTLRKKYNFQLRVMTAALRHIRSAQESPKRYPEPRLVRDLQNLTSRVCAELAQTGMTVLPSYFEYDLHRDWAADGSAKEEYRMIKAIGAEDLPVSHDWSFAEGIPAPEFVKWGEAFSPITHVLIELFL